MTWRVLLNQSLVLAAFPRREEAEKEREHLVQAHGYRAADLSVDEEKEAPPSPTPS